MQILQFLLEDAIELGLIWSLLSLGIYISFRILNFSDLTVDGSFAMGGGIAAIYISQGGSPIIGMLLAFLGGAVAGAITGLLHTKGKIPPLLAGIITMTGLYSINLRIMNSRAITSIYGISTIYTPLGELWNNRFLSLVLVTFFIVGLLLAAIYWFFGTELGCAIRATGMNSSMAKAQGIHTEWMVILGLAISNAFVALSGALLTQQQGFADVNMGRGVIVIGLAAIIIGETLFGKRTFRNSLLSIVLGTIVYYLLVGIAITFGLNPNDLKLLNAVLIAIILMIPVIKKKWGRNHAKN